MMLYVNALKLACNVNKKTKKKIYSNTARSCLSRSKISAILHQYLVASGPLATSKSLNIYIVERVCFVKSFRRHDSYKGNLRSYKWNLINDKEIRTYTYLSTGHKKW